MMHDLSLAHLTVISLAPPQMVDVAARTGYRYVGLRLIAVTPDSPGYPLMNDKTMMRETKARLADTGIGIHDSSSSDLHPRLTSTRVFCETRRLLLPNTESTPGPFWLSWVNGK
jgi:hypothetical protein